MSNGALPASELTTVQAGIELETQTAISYRAMLAAGMPGSIAEPAGGYRTLAVQAAMREHPAEYNVPASEAHLLAPVGASPHGLGICVDIVPAAAVAWVEQHGAAYGFTRRAANDPNCFIHTAVGPTQSVQGAHTVQSVAAYLNGLYGPRYHSNAATNGVRGPIYWRMVQMWGKANGHYGPGYLINGVPGPQSRRVEAILLAAH